MFGQHADLQPVIGDTHDSGTAGSGHRDALLDAIIVPETVAVGELPGAVEQVAVSVRRPVSLDPVLAEAETHTGVEQSRHGQWSHRPGSHGDYSHVGTGQELDQLALARLAHRRQGEAVADRH